MSQPFIRPGKEAAALSGASKDGIVGKTGSVVVATQSAARNGANDKSQNGIAGIAGGSSWLCDCFGNDNVVATQAAARNDANDKSQQGIAGGSLWPCRVWVYLCGLKWTMWAISFFLVLCYPIIGIFSVKYSARYWFGLTSAVLGVIVGICTAYRDWKNEKEAKAAAKRAQQAQDAERAERIEADAMLLALIQSIQGEQQIKTVPQSPLAEDMTSTTSNVTDTAAPTVRALETVPVLDSLANPYAM
jgi:hypothetical protein